MTLSWKNSAKREGIKIAIMSEEKEREREREKLFVEDFLCVFV